MNRQDLHWVAQQLHSGKPQHQVSLAGVDLSSEARLQLVDQALRAFPTEASLWVDSNEVVLPVREMPGNIQAFNRFPQAPPPPRRIRATAPRMPGSKAAVKSSPLMVHWSLKITVRRQKQKLYLDLIWREESLRNAYRDFLEGVGGWAAVEQVHLEYIDLIRGANAFIAAVWDDQDEYYWTRSKSWQNSDSAWAYRVWMEKWELEIASPSLPPRGGGAEFKVDASKVLRGFPDHPAE